MGAQACSCLSREEDDDPSTGQAGRPCQLRPVPQDAAQDDSSPGAAGCCVEAGRVISGRCLRSVLDRRAPGGFKGATPREALAAPSVTSIWRVDVTSSAAGRPLGFLKPPETVPEEAFGKSSRGRFMGHKVALGGPGRRPRTQIELDCLDAVRAFRVHVLCLARAVVDGSSHMIWYPGDGVRLKHDDTLHVAGSEEAVKRFAAAVGDCRDIGDEMQWNVIPVQSKWVGWRIGRRTDSFPLGLNVRLTCGAEPLALRQADGSVHMFPGPETELFEGQELLFMRSLSSQPEAVFEFAFQAQLLDLDSWRFFSGAGSTAVLGAHLEGNEPSSKDTPSKISDREFSKHAMLDKIATQEEVTKIKLGSEDDRFDPGPLEQPEFEPQPPGDGSRCSGKPVLAAPGLSRYHSSSLPALNLKLRTSRAQRQNETPRTQLRSAWRPSGSREDTGCTTARTDGGMTRSTMTPRDERCLSARTEGSASARGAMTRSEHRFTTARTETSLSVRGIPNARSEQQCMTARTDGSLSARGPRLVPRSQYYSTWESPSSPPQTGPALESSHRSEAW